MKKNLYPIVLIGISIILIYGRMLDNFFYQDDYNWLLRIINLGQKPLSLLEPAPHPSIPYISTLVYIVYWINYKIFGLNPYSYHLFSLLLHILNSYLVMSFVFIMCGRLTLSIFVSFIFAINFAVTDAVIWPAAYVDTVMASFYILSLIAFASFLKRGGKHNYLLSIIFFVMSLLCKGTALTLPIALLFLENYLLPQKNGHNKLYKYLPFLIIDIGYLWLLNSSKQMLNQIDLGSIFTNIIKVPMTLLIPESLLPVGFLWALVCFFMISIFVLWFLTKGDTTGIGRLGALLLFAGIAPLITVNWRFPFSDDPFVLFNHSIRHRLYLGNLGFAMLAGAIMNYFYSLGKGRRRRIAASMLLVTFSGYNLFWNQKIQSRWDKVTDNTRDALNEFKDMVKRSPADKIFYFINFPPNQGVGDAFFKLYFPDYNVGIWPTEIPPHPDTVKINYYLQLNGHLYNNPNEAANNAVTPWEHFFVGQFYLLMGDKIKGVAELEKATAFESEEKLHLLAADTYKKLGLDLKAMHELKKVISINKNSLKGYEALGGIAFKTGDYDSAINWYEKVIYLNKKDSTTMGKLAELYEHKGDVNKAREMWEKALKYENRKEIRETIKRKLYTMQ